MDEDDLRMLRERIRQYRKVADQSSDPMTQILLADMIAMFEEIEELERMKPLQRY
ncbi:hypothetical protein [Bradyrhizobium manausense]|uniref:hypothetical protein n=1 Tax=Bradyrhizobium manausense TaxID=989370 RepID=UPI000AD23C68|nr:hypothetical protein [Bradyrhizobium manausense]